MGKGKGLKTHMDLIFRVAELVLLVFGLTLFMIPSDSLLLLPHRGDFMEACDAMDISGSLYLIILLIVLGLQVIKNEELDKTFMGVLSTIGAILMISTGLCVCIFARNASKLLISGIIGIVAGAALVVDALKDFNVF